MNRRRATIALIVLLFLAVRIPLLLVRQPFYDELATVVFARAPISELWPMLQRDSASPLYLVFARLVENIAGFTVRRGRLLSLAFATLTLLALLTYRSPLAGRRPPADPRAAWIAAALLSVFFPHVYFSTEARAYALAALLIGIAVLALHRFLESRGTRWLLMATCCVVLAAYSHAYGALSFPALLAVSVMTRDRRAIVNGTMAMVVAGVLFFPGFLLARSQPVDSIAWMETGALPERLALVVGTVMQFGFAGPLPSLLISTLSPWLRSASFIVVCAVAIWGVWKSRDARVFLLLTMIPIAGVLAFALAGRTFYFPGRFESVLSVPFVMLLSSGILTFPNRLRVLLVATLLGLGAIVCTIAIADHANRPPDPFRQISRFARFHVDSDTPIVGSSYMYLEVLSQRDARWRPTVIAFPAEQAGHPGWAVQPSRHQLALEIGSLPARFVWLGIRNTPEEKVITENFTLRLLASNDVAVAVEAKKKTKN